MRKGQTLLLVAVAVAMIAIGSWEIAAAAIGVLTLSAGLAWFSPKPVLVLSPAGIELNWGRIRSRANWSEISDVRISGTSFLGRSAVVLGSISVSIAGRGPVHRKRLNLPDVFAPSLEALCVSIKDNINKERE